MKFLQKKASLLLESYICQPDGAWKKGSLLPFFDREGMIRGFLILVPYSGEVYYLNNSKAYISLSIHRFVWLKCPFDALPRLQDAGKEVLANLWHFDPEWLFAKEPFRDHPMAAEVKQTNCVKHFIIEIKDLYLSKDLLSVSRVQTKDQGEIDWHQQISSMLLEPEEAAFAEVQEDNTGSNLSSGWILDPIWLKK